MPHCYFSGIFCPLTLVYLFLYTYIFCYFAFSAASTGGNTVAIDNKIEQAMVRFFVIKKL